MYAVIHDTYYRDTPERIQLSGMVSIKETCRFMVSADFKAGHAPDDAGDSRRPPMTAMLVFSGDELKELLLNKRYTETIPFKPDDIREVLLKCAQVSTTGKRWNDLHLTIGDITRSSAMLILRANALAKEVMSIALPLGVLDEMLSSTLYLQQNPRVRELVLTWPTVNYRGILKATATTLA